MSLVSHLDRDHVMFWFTIHYTVPDFQVTVDALLHKTDGYGTLIEWTRSVLSGEKEMCTQSHGQIIKINNKKLPSKSHELPEYILNI